MTADDRLRAAQVVAGLLDEFGDGSARSEDNYLSVVGVHSRALGISKVAIIDELLPLPEHALEQLVTRRGHVGCLREFCLLRESGASPR